jgi:hypothetical protein
MRFYKIAESRETGGFANPVTKILITRPVFKVTANQIRYYE